MGPTSQIISAGLFKSKPWKPGMVPGRNPRRVIMSDMRDLSDMQELTEEELDIVAGGGFWSRLVDNMVTIYGTSPASLLVGGLKSAVKG